MMMIPNVVRFWFGFKVLLKGNCLHLVCYAAVFLLQFSWRVCASAWKSRLRNDLYSVEWDVEPYSLTHSLALVDAIYFVACL